MATARLTISSPSAGYSGWEITISNIFGDDQVKDKTKYLSSIVTAVSPISGSLFSIQTASGSNKVDGYSGSGIDYVTWRSTSPTGQHPTSGLSLDIHNSALYEDIITNSNTWNAIASASPYSLDPNTHSLVYNYSNLYPPLFSKGGTLTISIEA